jgi:hypothetical protein
MVRENTGVRTKIAKISGGMREIFVRTELTWQSGKDGVCRSIDWWIENRRAQKFGRKFAVVPWATRRVSAEVAITCAELGGVEGV